MIRGLTGERERSRHVLPLATTALATAVVTSLSVVVAPAALTAVLGASAGLLGLVQPVVGLALLVPAAAAMLVIGHPVLVVGLASLTTALLLVASWGTGTPRQMRTPRITALLVGYLLMSWLVAASQSTAHFDAMALLSLWGLQLSPMLLAFALTRPLRELSVLQWTVVAVAAIVGALQIASPLQPGASLEEGLAGALASGRNALGVLFLLALAIVLPRIRISMRPDNLLLLGVALLLAIAIASSLSRSSYVAAAAVALTFLLMRGWRLGAVAVIATLVIVPLALGGEVNSLQQAVTRLTATISPSGLDASSGARLDLWSAALRAAADHPLFGLGWQQFASNLGQYWEGSVSRLAVFAGSAEYSYAHNLYLTMLSQGGLVGALLLVAMMVSCARDAIEATGRYRETAVLGLVAVGAACLFGEPFLIAAVSVPFFVINALARMSRSADEAER